MQTASAAAEPNRGSKPYRMPAAIAGTFGQPSLVPRPAHRTRARHERVPKQQGSPVPPQAMQVPLEEFDVQKACSPAYIESYRGRSRNRTVPSTCSRFRSSGKGSRSGVPGPEQVPPEHRTPGPWVSPGQHICVGSAAARLLTHTSDANGGAQYRSSNRGNTPRRGWPHFLRPRPDTARKEGRRLPLSEASRYRPPAASVNEAVSRRIDCRIRRFPVDEGAIRALSHRGHPGRRRACRLHYQCPNRRLPSSLGSR